MRPNQSLHQWGVLGCLLAGIFGAFLSITNPIDSQNSTSLAGRSGINGIFNGNLGEVQDAHDSFNPGNPSEEFIYPFSIKKNATLYSELLKQGFKSQDIQPIVKASAPYFDLSRLPEGLRYKVYSAHESDVLPPAIEFRLSPTQTLKLVRAPENQWEAHYKEYPIETQIVSFTGIVQSSLWDSARTSKMNPQLIAQLTEVFGWTLDFSRQVSQNDSWRLTVEQQLVKGHVVGWGRILAAEYKNNNRSYHAVYFDGEEGIRGYYDLDGKSLSKTFLRSPIEFARISSGFSLRRFHPKLKVYRPHLGVDYAAPHGTPIRALGDGVVQTAHFTESGGKTIALTHGSAYKTRYLHMSRFAPQIRVGATVKQGEIIGYVGSTGLSTGPHLHFEFYRNNRYVDPLKVELPARQSIPSHTLALFQEVAARKLNQLPPLPQTVATN